MNVSLLCGGSSTSAFARAGRLYQLRYMVNVVDTELAKFVSLLEYYERLNTSLPDSYLYHA